LLQTPQIIAPGLLDNKEDVEFLSGLAEDVEVAIETKRDVTAITESARRIIRKVIRDELDKNPIIEVHVAKL